VSRPPKVEASNTTAKAMILLALNDTIPLSCIRSPWAVYPLEP
jgi:hypothetical protein